MPVISVLMSAFNAEKFISEAIESVLNQTFSDFEFIIYDDASTDKTLAIIESYNDPRIVLIKNLQNKGLTRNLHDGMLLAQGKFLARMDADDVCMPDRFEKQVNFLENNSIVSVLGSSVIFFDDNGYNFVAYQPESHEEIVVQLLFDFTLLHPSVMLRIKEFRQKKLNYNTSYRYAQDHDLWFRASQHLKLANTREPLLKMREHSSKISSTLKPEQKKVSDKVREEQFKAYGFHLSSSECNIFHRIAVSDSSLNSKELKIFEHILLKIIETNASENKLDQMILKHKSAEVFRGWCREMLIKKRKNAQMLYWKSSLRKFDNISFRNKLTLLIRTLIYSLSKHV